MDLRAHEPLLQSWLDAGFHGQMEYMARHGLMRARPGELLPGTLRVISARINYMPEDARCATTLEDPTLGYISRYALGRDYHKVVRKKLKLLAERLQQALPELKLNYRPFVDSAPILERPLAEQAGLGWIGKHTLLLNQQQGSLFFIGELLIDLPLPMDAPANPECGKCTACIKACPTGAIVAPYQLDARRCISYLTIEHAGPIPPELRSAIGNRIYGCDDCQLICPWNRYAPVTQESDFSPRQQLLQPELLELFSWSESEFLKVTEGSPIRRIGFERWQRNLAVALGNAPYQPRIIEALEQRQAVSSELVKEHVDWALEQQKLKKDQEQVENRQKARLIRWIKKALPFHA